MSEAELDRILDAIAATSDSESEEAFCDQTQALLAAYVELELAGERADRAYPAVARHLIVCPDCREEYESLRALLIDREQASLPDATLDLARLPPAPMPSAPSQASTWARSLPRLAGAVRGGQVLEEYDMRVPSLGAGITLHLLADLEVERASLRGYFTPPQPALHGLSARLYGVAAAAEFAVVMELEAPIEELGEFAFTDLLVGDYVLTLRLTNDEIPVILLGADFWKA